MTASEHIKKYTSQDVLWSSWLYHCSNFELYRKFDSAGSLTVERQTVHINDDPPIALGTSTGRIAMLEKRTYGTDDSEEELVRYIYSNHLQSSALELDAGGSIISYEEYHPYGTTAYQAMNALIKVTAKRYRYTGKERDEESGLYYHGARYYIPWLCRWSAVDPINSENYNLQKGYGLEKNLKRSFLELTASPYEYCYDNPIRFNDPNGEQVPPGQIDPVQWWFNEGSKLFNNAPREAKTLVSETGAEVAKKQISLMSLNTHQEYIRTELKLNYPSISGTYKIKDSLQQYHVDESDAKKYKNYELAVVDFMLRNFVTGKGAENYYFKENGIISSKFFKSHILNEALKNYLDAPDTYRGGPITFGVLSLFNDIRQNMTLSSITGMVGSAKVTLLPTERGLEIKIFNTTSLRSGAFGKELGKVFTGDDSLYP